MVVFVLFFGGAAGRYRQYKRAAEFRPLFSIGNPLCGMALFDHFEARVGHERFRDADAFGRLVVFEQGGNDAR